MLKFQQPLLFSVTVFQLIHKINHISNFLKHLKTSQFQL